MPTGTYDSPPGPRMDYARDGSAVGYYYTPGTGSFGTGTGQPEVVEFSTAQKDALNKEDYAGTTDINDDDNVQSSTFFVFPEPRDLVGMYMNRTSGRTSGLGSGEQPVYMYTSVDTTNAVDGVWTSIGTYPVDVGGEVVSGGSADDGYRNLIQGLSFSGVRCLRLVSSGGLGGIFGSDTRFSRIHLYGTSSLLAGRLRCWHPVSDVEVTGEYFDWGDTPRSSSTDIPFRIKNTSTAMTSTNTVVQFITSQADSIPSSVFHHFISDDGLVFRGSLTIASIGPQQITSTLYLRRVMSSDAQLLKPFVTKLAMNGTWL